MSCSFNMYLIELPIEDSIAFPKSLARMEKVKLQAVREENKP
jgi:hypothetical protein